MPTTLASLRLELRDRIALDDNDPMAGEQDYDRAINSALQTISAERDWPWLLATSTFAVVPHVATITVTEAVGKVVVARIDGNNPLDYMTQDGLDLLYTPTDSGTPAAYTLAGNTLTLYPVPQLAGTLSITYYATEPTLYNDTDTALIPVRFQAAVVEKAAATMMRRVRSTTRMQAAEAAYDKWLGKMLDDQRRSAGSGQVKIRPGGWI